MFVATILFNFSVQRHSSRQEREAHASGLIHFGSKFTSLTGRVQKQRSTNVPTYTNRTADEWAKHKEGHICRDMILLSQFI